MMMPDADQATLGEHLEALRQTLIRVLIVIGAGSVICFLGYRQLVDLLTYPFQMLPNAQPLVLLGPADGFSIALRLSFWCSLTVTSPVWLYLIFRFLQPALMAHERHTLMLFSIVSAVFMALGILFAYYVTIPIANQSLFAFNATMGQNLWSLNHYIDYTILLLLATVLSFELAALFMILVHTGKISANWLQSQRRVMIVCIFVLSALLTPPDVLTQLLMAVPLILFYEVLVLFARYRKI